MHNKHVVLKSPSSKSKEAVMSAFDEKIGHLSSKQPAENSGNTLKLKNKIITEVLKIPHD